MLIVILHSHPIVKVEADFSSNTPSTTEPTLVPQPTSECYLPGLEQAEPGQGDFLLPWTEHVLLKDIVQEAKVISLPSYCWTVKPWKRKGIVYAKLF